MCVLVFQTDISGKVKHEVYSGVFYVKEILQEQQPFFLKNDNFQHSWLTFKCTIFT